MQFQPDTPHQCTAPEQSRHADLIAKHHPMSTTWEQLRRALGVIMFTVSNRTPAQCEEFLEDAAKAGPLKVIREQLQADAGAIVSLDAMVGSRLHAAIGMLDLLVQQHDLRRRGEIVGQLKTLVVGLATPARTGFDDRAVWALVNAAEQAAHHLEKHPSAGMQATASAMTVRSAVMAVRMSATGIGESHPKPRSTPTTPAPAAQIDGTSDLGGTTGNRSGRDDADALGRG